MLRTWALAALLAFLTACKGGTTVSTAPTPVPDTCSGDSECPARFRCDRDLRRCVCTGDDACPGKFCNAFTGMCVDTVPGCTANSQCTAGQYCNTALRSCKPITQLCQACKGDAECGDGSACGSDSTVFGGNTYCVPKCGASCPTGFTCKGTACIPDKGCSGSNICVPDSLKLCSAAADCGDPAQTCDTTLKACVARVRTCPAGDACDPQSKLCVHACASDSDCFAIEGNKPGYQCRNNACYALTLCGQDSDCTAGNICQPNPDGSKSCKPGCETSSDCPLGQGCNKTDPNHPRCSSGCTQNTDCPLNTICTSAGACASTTGSCQQTCQDTAACPIGSTCSNNCCVAANLATACGQSSVCSPCTVGGGCVGDCTKLCFALALASCNVQADCSAFPSGVVCYHNACQINAHLANCTSDADCGMKGFRCEKLTDFGPSCGTGSVCIPFERAANVACALGHP